MIWQSNFIYFIDISFNFNKTLDAKTEDILLLKLANEEIQCLSCSTTFAAFRFHATNILSGSKFTPETQAHVFYKCSLVPNTAHTAL